MKRNWRNRQKQGEEGAVEQHFQKRTLLVMKEEAETGGVTSWRVASENKSFHSKILNLLYSL